MLVADRSIKAEVIDSPKPKALRNIGFCCRLGKRSLAMLSEIGIEALA